MIETDAEALDWLKEQHGKKAPGILGNLTRIYYEARHRSLPAKDALHLAQQAYLLSIAAGHVAQELEEQVEKGRISLHGMIRLFQCGELSRKDGDTVLFDKGECTLETEKPFRWEESCDEVAWKLLRKEGVHCC